MASFLVPRYTSEQALYRLLRLFSKVRARSCRCSSFPQEVTLDSPARPKTPSRRLPVATNLLRDAPKAHGIFFVPGRQKNEILSRNVTLNSLQDLMAVLQQIVEEGEAVPWPGRFFAATVYSMRQSVNDPGPPDRAGLQPVLAHSYALPSGC